MPGEEVDGKYSKFKQKFKQQRLPAWQPILTADTVLPAFFLFGFLFIPLGIALLIFSNNVNEKQIDYTNCTAINPIYENQPCQDIISDPANFDRIKMTPCRCRIEFSLEKSFQKNVYMYYGLDNFYQNHRRYVKSRDNNQLLGQKLTAAEIDPNCRPFDKEEGEGGLVYAPCGAIANSLFNDTLVLQYKATGEDVTVLKKNISWPSDRGRKFNNPPGSMDENSDDFAFKDTVKPMYWSKNVWELDKEDPSNNGYENEALIVWMRTAAFPSFRKLYGRIDHSKEGFKHGLSDGDYTLMVQYDYPVKSFGGSKRFILSTTSFLGGKNNFLGIAYISVGAICLLTGVIFLILHIKYGKKPADLQNITANTPYYD